MTARHATRYRAAEEARPRSQLQHPRLRSKMQARDQHARRENQAPDRDEEHERELMRIGSAPAKSAPDITPLAGHRCPQFSAPREHAVAPPRDAAPPLIRGVGEDGDPVRRAIRRLRERAVSVDTASRRRAERVCPDRLRFLIGRGGRATISFAPLPFFSWERTRGAVVDPFFKNRAAPVRVQAAPYTPCPLALLAPRLSRRRAGVEIRFLSPPYVR